MRPHTHQQGIPMILAAVLMTALTTIGTAQTDDPNALFAADWDSATLAVTVFRSDDATPAVKNVVSVTGNVYIPDVNDLVAVSGTHAAAVQAFDQDGAEVLFDPNVVEPEPGRTWWLGTEPLAYSVAMRLDPNQLIPTSLSELDFTVEAMYAESYITVDLPLEVTTEPIELLPNFHVSVTEVNVAGETCVVATVATITDVSGRSTRSFDPNDGPWEETILHSGRVITLSDLDVIYREAIVDADGNADTRIRGTSHASHSSGGVTTATARFTLRDCSDVEGLYLRYTIAMYPYEVPILLTVTDVAIPGL